MIPGDVAVLTLAPPGRGEPCAALLHDGDCTTGALAEVVEAARRLEADRSPRWVWWSAEAAAAPLVEAWVPVARAWDVAEAHRLLHGGWSATGTPASRRGAATASADHHTQRGERSDSSRRAASTTPASGPVWHRPSWRSAADGSPWPVGVTASTATSPGIMPSSVGGRSVTAGHARSDRPRGVAG